MRTLGLWIMENPELTGKLAVLAIGIIGTAGAMIIQLYRLWTASKNTTAVLAGAIEKNEILESAGIIRGAAKQIKSDVKTSMGDLTPNEKVSLIKGVVKAKQEWSLLKQNYASATAERKKEKEKKE